jgi:diguanylate cyclase (GGDEF)-like protein
MDNEAGKAAAPSAGWRDTLRSESGALALKAAGAVLSAIAVAQIAPVQRALAAGWTLPGWLLAALLLAVAGAAAGLTYWRMRQRQRRRIAALEQDLGTLREQLQSSADRATRDALTGAYLANQIEPLLGSRIAEARAARQNFALLFVDIDGFKRINDRYNHDTGNRVLRQFAQVITPRSAGDLLIRYGGDEFLLISKPGLDAEQGFLFAQRLRLEVRQSDFLIERDSVAREHLTMSCGLTDFDAAADSVESMLARAAEALRIAKSHVKHLPDGSVQAKDFVHVLSAQGRAAGQAAG